jgi:hypothetical protein
MPTLSPQVTPYYGGGQVLDPANVIKTSGAPSSANIYNKLGTIAVDNAAATAYMLVSKSGGVATWIDLGGGAGSFTTLTVTGLSTLGALTQVGTANINVTGTAVTTIGNATGGVSLVGATGVTGTLTASTGLVATTGNLTLSGVGSGLVTTPTVVAAGASPQTANGRIVDVTFSGVSIAAGASQSLVIANSAVPASTSSYLLSMVGATAGAGLSIVSVTNLAATSTTIVVTNATGASTSTANIRFTMAFLN